MVRFVLIDLDNTILDFRKSERLSLCRTLAEMGVQITDEQQRLYSRINLGWWERLERGEITRQEVLVGRFREFLNVIGADCSPETVTERYENGLRTQAWVMPGARETLLELKKSCAVYVASNGSSAVQHDRLRLSGLEPLFDGLMISEELGAEKPSKAFFDRGTAQIPGYDPGQAVMVGDSLTSDILGGIRAGIRTVWLRPSPDADCGKVVPDRMIDRISDLPACLAQM